MITKITVTNDDGTTEDFVSPVPPVDPDVEVFSLPLDTDIKIVAR